ncbi:MAG: glutamate 5-kinase [Alphaproteobacteria bacterium]|nr:glutamate 5-kinase [Alphaproteobacteria bacterium]
MTSHALTTSHLNDATTVVVKVGSALLVDEHTGAINAAWLHQLAADLALLTSRRCRCVVVSSGAIALGRTQLKGRAKSNARLKLEEKQAAAAIGQVQLASEWKEALNTHDLSTAQILLSPDDTEQRRRHLNARATITTLLDSGIIPVVNENDTVATMEIRYGDNDRLAARVAQMISADVLILLSDIDGLYSADPRHHPDARHIPQVTAIDDDLRAMAGPANEDYASGGMVTKIEAGRIATQAGCHMVICNGTAMNPISALIDGATATWFTATAKPPQARKTWIAGGLNPVGTITLDDGAVNALQSGKSLLAAGMIAVDGHFERGDLVAVCDPQGQEIGRGLINYSAHDAARIAGCNSGEIQGILGYRGRDEVIHADDLVMTAST